MDWGCKLWKGIASDQYDKLSIEEDASPAFCEFKVGNKVVPASLRPGPRRSQDNAATLYESGNARVLYPNSCTMGNVVPARQRKTRGMHIREVCAQLAHAC